MGMSTSVIGIKPPGAKWKQMKAVYDACCDAGLPCPEEVDEFFDFAGPDEKGVVVSESDMLKLCVKEYNEESGSGFEVDLAKVPKDVTIIRFVNSW